MIGLDGRWIVYGLMTGAKVKEVNLAALMTKRVRIEFSSLRLDILLPSLFTEKTYTH